MKTKKSLQSFLVLGLFLLFSAFTFAQKTDFSGTWKLNQDQSQMGEGRSRMAAAQLNITQDDNTLNIERTGSRPNGNSYSVKEKYALDGSVSENTMFQNNVKKSTAAWSDDKKALTINSTSVMERDGNQMEMKSSEVYKLSDDGNTLTIQSTTTTPRGERKQTLVYQKQK